MRNKFGIYLKKIRGEKGETQVSLSKKLFISQTAVSHIESGKSIPNNFTIEKFSNVLGNRFEMYYLLNRIPKKNKKAFFKYANGRKKKNR